MAALKMNLDKILLNIINLLKIKFSIIFSRGAAVQLICCKIKGKDKHQPQDIGRIEKRCFSNIMNQYGQNQHQKPYCRPEIGFKELEA